MSFNEWLAITSVGMGDRGKILPHGPKKGAHGKEKLREKPRQQGEIYGKKENQEEKS